MQLIKLKQYDTCHPVVWMDQTQITNERNRRREKLYIKEIILNEDHTIIVKDGTIPNRIE